MGDEITATIDDVGSCSRRNLTRVQQAADGLQVNVDADHHLAIVPHRCCDCQRRNLERAGDIGSNGNRDTVLNDGLIPRALPRIEGCIFDVPRPYLNGLAVEKAKRRYDVGRLSLCNRSDRECRAFGHREGLANIVPYRIDDLQVRAIGIARVDARRVRDISQNFQKELLFCLDILGRRGSKLRQGRGECDRLGAALQRIPVSLDQPQAHLAHLLHARAHRSIASVAEGHPDDRRRRAQQRCDDQDAEMQS
ncbi:hypothetical protein ABIA10_002791 [Rhizobium leguminosarum]